MRRAALMKTMMRVTMNDADLRRNVPKNGEYKQVREREKGGWD